MVDFNKMLEEQRAKGKFLGYCNYCEVPPRLYETNILESYKKAPDSEKKCKCPKCGKFQLVSELIPF